MVEKYQRYENESEEELILRVCNDKEIIGSWEDVSIILNKILNYEYTSSKYRKQFQSFQKMLLGNESKFVNEQAILDDIKEQRRELEKEKIKMSDERTEYKRLLREQARRESFEDLVKKVISKEVKPIEFSQTFKNDIVNSDNDLIVHLTDLHVGIEIDNFMNKFNEEVFVDRMNQFLEEIKKVQLRHKSENCYVIAGEIASGLIHNNLRLENNLDLIEQFKLASNIISNFVLELSKVFNVVEFYTTIGNHSRVSPKKDDNLIGENIDLLLPFYLKASLQNVNNVKIKDNELEVTIADFEVRGKKIMSSHGDRDNPSSVVQNWTMMFGKKPDIVYLGHRHTNGLTTVYDTKVVESGTMSGSDTFAISNIRKCSPPSQTISVIDNEQGLVCLYDITLK